MTGSELFFLIQGLNDLSDQMEGIKARDGFLLTGKYIISGYTVDRIRKLTNQAAYEIINSVDFVPNGHISKKE